MLTVNSHLLIPTDRGLWNKFIKGLLHHQERTRLEAVACMVFGHEAMSAQVEHDCIVFGTMGSWKSGMCYGFFTYFSLNLLQKLAKIVDHQHFWSPQTLWGRLHHQKYHQARESAWRQYWMLLILVCFTSCHLPFCFLILFFQFQFMTEEESHLTTTAIWHKFMRCSLCLMLRCLLVHS